MTNLKRKTLTFTPATVEHLNKMQEQTGAESIGQVIADSIRFYNERFKEAQAGGKLLHIPPPPAQLQKSRWQRLLGFLWRLSVLLEEVIIIPDVSKE